jgi:hypothetical protein
VHGVLSDGHRRWVPGGRWDLVADDVRAAEASSVAVVVPYFEQPDSLLRLYAALGAGRLPAGSELLVVDDGSTCPPPAPPADLGIPVRRLRQDDLGCRPGAARNRAVAATDAEVLVFLDADTLPALDTVSRLARWPWVLPDAVVVGRRHHVDLTGWTPAATVDWLRGRADPPSRGPDPAWLEDGYATTGNLLRADRRSYRYVISAVMACSRALYDDVGGFAGSRSEYGGEDWEFAHRAWVHGAVLVHDPDAVAWHDEPDWQQRTGSPVGAKNLEAMWLGTTVPDPLTRGRGVLQARADVEIRLDLPAGATVGQYVATIDALLVAVPDCVVLLPDDVPPRVVSHTAFDPRVQTSLAGRALADPARPPSSMELVLRRPGTWAVDGLRALLADALDGDETAVDVMADATVVATLRPRRATGRLRRARRLGVAPGVARGLDRRRLVRDADVGFRCHRGEVDRAAELGGWARH